MKFFKKAIEETKELDKAIAPEAKPEEEWIWVEGYKGTDANMCCRGYQYELGKQYDMPEGEKIEECESGFHLCLSLQDVFYYYGIGGGNRFFKVKALVCKTDKNSYRGSFKYGDEWYTTSGSRNKIVAKSIIFTSELTYDEILKDSDAQNLPKDYQKIAIDVSIGVAVESYRINTLIEDGYSVLFAKYIIDTDRFDIAHAVGSQKDLSMDMKVLVILKEI